MKERVLKSSQKEKFIKKAKDKRLVQDNALNTPERRYQTIHERATHLKNYVNSFDEETMSRIPQLVSAAKLNMPPENREQYTEFSTMIWLHDPEGYEHAVYKDAIISSRLELPYQGMPHTHDYIEMMYVISGGIDQSFFGETHHFEAGDFLIIDKNCAHRDLFDKDTGIVLFICVQSDYLESVLKYCDHTNVLYRFLLQALYTHQNEQSYLHLKPNASDEIIGSLLEQLVYEDHADLPGNQEIIGWYLIRLLGRLCENYGVQIYSTDNPQNKERMLLHEIERYIRTHLADITVQELETQFHYYRNYYNLLLKKYRQQSFREYVQMVRMEQAEYLLSATDLPIKQVAFQVGYENTSFFYHLFEKHFGMSPQELKNKVRES